MFFQTASKQALEVQQFGFVWDSETDRIRVVTYTSMRTVYAL